MPRIKPIPVDAPVPPGTMAQPAAGTGSAVPTTSTWAGALLGGAVGQLIVAACEFYALHGGNMKAATAGSIISVCTFATGYIFKDGRR